MAYNSTLMILLEKMIQATKTKQKDFNNNNSDRK